MSVNLKNNPIWYKFERRDANMINQLQGRELIHLREAIKSKSELSEAADALILQAKRENETEYIVTFEADNSRTFSVAGIIAGAVTLISLIGSNFDLSSLFTGLVVFGLLSVIGHVISTVSFPVYFTGIRNNIERRIQSLQRQI